MKMHVTHIQQTDRNTSVTVARARMHYTSAEHFGRQARLRTSERTNDASNLDKAGRTYTDRARCQLQADISNGIYAFFIFLLLGRCCCWFIWSGPHSWLALLETNNSFVHSLPVTCFAYACTIAVGVHCTSIYRGEYWVYIFSKLKGTHQYILYATRH